MNIVFCVKRERGTEGGREGEGEGGREKKREKQTTREKERVVGKEGGRREGWREGTGGMEDLAVWTFRVWGLTQAPHARYRLFRVWGSCP